MSETNENCEHEFGDDLTQFATAYTVKTPCTKCGQWVDPRKPKSVEEASVDGGQCSPLLCDHLEALKFVQENVGDWTYAPDAIKAHFFAAFADQQTATHTERLEAALREMRGSFASFIAAVETEIEAVRQFIPYDEELEFWTPMVEAKTALASAEEALNRP